MLKEINSLSGVGAAEKLREMATAIGLHHARNPAQFQLIIRPEPELPVGIDEFFSHGRRQVLKEFVRTIDDGIYSGEFRSAAPRSAS